MAFGGVTRCSAAKWPVHKDGSGHRPKGVNCERRHKHCLLCAPAVRASFGVLDLARARGR